MVDGRVINYVRSECIMSTVQLRRGTVQSVVSKMIFC